MAATTNQRRVVVITGGSSGIGAALAIECARAGMDVVMGARRVDRLQETAKQIEALGGKAVCVACDVDKDADVQALVDRAMKEFGKIDIAVANAGYGIFKALTETSDAEVRQMFETNFYGTIRLVRAVVPIMKKQGGGQIVMTSSAASEIGPGLMSVYAATKASQKSLAQSIRAELKTDKIFITSVHPIGTTTEFSKVAREKANITQTKANTPVAFRQTPEHVARRMVKNMKRKKPRPEVWPNGFMRFVLAMLVAFPSLSAYGLTRQFERMKSQDLGEEMK